MSIERAREQLELAEGRWQTAIKEHAQPPPTPDTPVVCARSRTRPLRSMPPTATPRSRALGGGPVRLGSPQELRDAPWRSSLASDEVRQRFDDAVQSLSRARTGVSVSPSQAFGQPSAAAWDLADGVEQRQRQPRSGRAS